MATITASIGTRSAENVDITGVSGSGPYTVTLSGATTTTHNGDTLTDEAGTPDSFLITAGAGTASLTVEDAYGVGAGPDFSATSQATTTRSYSTIQAWEDQLNNTAAGNIAYSSGDDAVGEVYNDSVYDESPDIDAGSASGLTSATITVPETERHDGTAGTGARIVRTGISGYIFRLDANDPDYILEWLEIDGNGNDWNQIIDMANQDNFAKNCIGHDVVVASGTTYGINMSSTRVYAFNNILYDIASTVTGTGSLIGLSLNGTGVRVSKNNTLYNLSNDNGTGKVAGVHAGDAVNVVCQNTIVMGTNGTASGGALDFEFLGSSSVNSDNNMSSDDTADDGGGSNHLINKTTADQFVSTTGGSEDLHLKSGSDAIDAGLDLGTTDGVNIDIDGRDRDAEGDTWDMGAHEFVAATPAGPTTQARQGRRPGAGAGYGGRR